MPLSSQREALPVGEELEELEDEVRMKVNTRSKPVPLQQRSSSKQSHDEDDAVRGNHDDEPSDGSRIDATEGDDRETLSLSRHTSLATVSNAVYSMWKLHSSYSEQPSIPKADLPTYIGMTHIGKAAYDALWKNQARHKNQSWNLTKSKVVGDLWNTPRVVLDKRRFQRGIEPSIVCPSEAHDEWLPRQMGDLIAQTNRWCDITSLSPPDGLFLTEFQRGLLEIYQRQVARSKGDAPTLLYNRNHLRVTIRMMFGNIVGSPIDCNAFIRVLTSVLPDDAGEYIQLWVGSWRKSVSWNHSKIIAVDGEHLWTGGHK